MPVDFRSQGRVGDLQDADGDGEPDSLYGGADCDDFDPDTHPGAAERCDDGVAQDCDEWIDCDDDDCWTLDCHPHGVRSRVAGGTMLQHFAAQLPLFLPERNFVGPRQLGYSGCVR